MVSLAWTYVEYTWGVGYVCGHKSDMNNGEHWWLVIQWHDIDMRGDAFSWLVTRVGIGLTCDTWGLFMDVGMNFLYMVYTLFLGWLYMLVNGQYVIP